MINIIFIFLITIIVAYIFGLILVNMIDNRLNKINLNSMEKFENKIEIVDSSTYNNNTGVKYDTKYNTKYYKQLKKELNIEGFSHNSFEEWNIEKKKTHVCIQNHNHIKDGRDLNCTYGVTNYADPKDMSPIDYNIFYLNYPSNMTLQDYINWLYCYIDKESELPYNHLKNLEKLKLGKELIEEEGILPPPGYNYPPLNSKDYFDKIYNSTNEFQIASPLNSQTGPMIGYNYDEYSEFSQNFNINGTTGIIQNKDISLKKNIKELHNYIDSKDSTRIDDDNKNEIYRIKNIEI